MSTDFYVYVVESPSSRDLLEGALEGRVLYQALSLTGIDCTYSIAADTPMFREALGPRLVEKLRADNFQRWPILHLSAHGCREGIALTNESHFVTWSELMHAFRLLNMALQGRLMLAVSSCYGSFAAFEAFAPGDDPFFSLVGPENEAPVSDLAIGFSAFYHVLSKTWDLRTAYEAMKVASHNNSFKLHLGEDLRQARLQRQIDEILAKMGGNGIPDFGIQQR